MERQEAKDEQVRVTLTFYRPEHEYELREALNAGRYKSVLNEMDNWLRNEVKYGEDGTRTEILDQARSRLHEFLENENVNLWDE